MMIISLLSDMVPFSTSADAAELVASQEAYDSEFPKVFLFNCQHNGKLEKRGQ